GRGGVGAQLANALPAGGARIVLLRSGQLKNAQDAARALRAVANFAVVLVVALLAAAVAVAEDRRRAVRTCAFGLLAGALLLIVVRRIVGSQLIDQLVASDGVRPAANSVWWIATEQLSLITVTVF